MKVISAIARGLLLLLVTLSLSLWVTSCMLSMTILNRETVASWLENSGVYRNFFGSIFTVQETPAGEDVPVLNQEVFSEALKRTFPAPYLQQETEKGLFAMYDWLEGKSDTVAFSVPINEKRKEFATHLTTLLEPKIEKLPQCSSRLAPTEEITCLPPTMSAKQFTEDIAKQVAEGSQFLDKPIQAQDLRLPQIPQAELARWYVQHISWFIFGLPVLALSAAAGFIALRSDKLYGGIVLAYRTFFASFFSLIPGILLWSLGTTVSLEALMQSTEGAQAGTAAKIIDPLLQQILPSVGMWLTIFGGSIISISGLTLLGLYAIRKHKGKVTVPPSPANPEAPRDLPPVNPPTPPAPPQPPQHQP